ncbi:MAG: aldo/keto reductase [Planctomycetota bacterium]|jgi:aryl-alcohol dehydrogenase-like predicted oxidoreductase|nr:aldo/keto reductase [Planctomycetota bacterium]
MKLRKLGSSGIDASVIAFGAWAIGGWMWGGADEKEAIDAIHAALDNGINLIDTAPIYGFGRSEEIVGKALKGGWRKKAVVASKCGLVWEGTEGIHNFDSSEAIIDGNPRSKYHVYRFLGPKSIRREVENSLKRLGVDVIDVMQTHWQESTTPISETAGELLKLRQEGKIRAIGCSNATPEQMDEYRKVAPLDVDQEKYSMLDLTPEKTNLPYCEKNNVAFFAYSPLAQGLLAGAIGPDRVFSDTDQRAHDERYSIANRKLIMGFLEEIKPVADKHGLTYGQLVAGWTVSQPGCSHALLGARSVKQVIENAKAGSANLDAEDLAAIRKAMDARLANFKD